MTDLGVDYETLGAADAIFCAVVEIGRGWDPECEWDKDEDDYIRKTRQAMRVLGAADPNDIAKGLAAFAEGGWRSMRPQLAARALKRMAANLSGLADMANVHLPPENPDRRRYNAVAKAFITLSDADAADQHTAAAQVLRDADADAVFAVVADTSRLAGGAQLIADAIQRLATDRRR